MIFQCRHLQGLHRAIAVGGLPGAAPQRGAADPAISRAAMRVPAVRQLLLAHTSMATAIC